VSRPAMIHHSTRGEALALGFSDALLAGLARDGGLYWPKTFPTLTDAAISDFAGLPYADIANRVIPIVSSASMPMKLRLNRFQR